MAQSACRDCGGRVMVSVEATAVAIVPRWMADEQEIAAALERAQAALAPDVVRIGYSLEEDWTGESAIFVRILLADESVPVPNDVFPLADRIREKVIDEIKPYEQGLLPYFNFRTVSEQELLQEKAWD